MNEKIHEALNQISDTHLSEAEHYQKRRFPWWIGAAAAVLAVVITVSALPSSQSTPTQPDLYLPGTTQPLRPSQPALEPTVPQQPSLPDFTEPNTPSLDPVGGIDLSALQGLSDLLAVPTLPELTAFPNWDNYNEDWKAYNDALSQWQYSQHIQFAQPSGYADSLTDFFRRSIPEFLSSEENSAFSPVNVYLAIATLAETADGNSRQQILDLFGVDTIEALRTQANLLWNAHYNNDGQTTLLLSNSLWLDKSYLSRNDTVDRLAESYYASVFHSDLGTDASNAQLQVWLNAMTGGLLEEQVRNTELSKDVVFALASTIYFKAGWENEFSKSQTADAIFHTHNGDITTPFMNRRAQGIYYRGTNFGAVQLDLTGSNSMWIILPDEGVTVAQVLAGGEYLTMTLDPKGWQNKHECILVISLPKFDVASQSDLCKGMQNLGITDIFDSTLSDFRSMVDTALDGGLYVSQIDHTARVIIDEKGVEAATYTVIAVPGDSAPPETVITFTADRPFLFVVSSRDNLPLFVGTVAQP